MVCKRRFGEKYPRIYLLGFRFAVRMGLTTSQASFSKARTDLYRLSQGPESFSGDASVRGTKCSILLHRSAMDIVEVCV